MSNTTFAYGTIYPAWEIDEILASELWINLSTALVCVFLIVFITLADLCTCLLILSCVLFTMVDVLGLVYLWGMTLDPMTLICNIVGVGLSVDYGAHIAHAYIISQGSKKDRTCSGFISISPAVLHGGISTILALTPTAFARSYAFITSFKLLTLTVICGLFHGLLYLPVMLMLLGTDNVGNDIETENNENNEPRQRQSGGFPLKTHPAEEKKTRNGVVNPSLQLEES